VYWPYSFVPREVASTLGLRRRHYFGDALVSHAKALRSYEMYVLKTLRAKHGDAIAKNFHLEEVK
jgi:hypothetical protein